MNIAIYLRISDSDLDLYCKDESDSIENQRLLIMDYINRHSEIEGDIQEYVDDGYTGINMQRPAFQKMVSDARAKKIDVIIAKDLSRLGRDFIDMGDYIEQKFPLIGVRVIAINSNYDSDKDIGNIASIDVAINNYINSMYSMDLSQKRKTADRSRWAAGITSEKIVPYGYYRKNNTKDWVIDDPAAEVVKQIFEMASAGYRTISIANALNDRQIVTPGIYRNMKYKSNYTFKVSDKENIWDTSKVRTIIQRFEYTGVLRVHKTEVMDFSASKEKRIPKEKQIYIENHHPAIISKELFEDAQRAIRSTKSVKERKVNEDILKSKVVCGNCGLALQYRKYKGVEYCFCRHKKSAGSFSSCSDKKYNFELIERTVYEQIKRNIAEIRQGIIFEEKPIIDNLSKVFTNVNTLKNKVSVLKAERVRQYENYASGNITYNDFMSKKIKLNDKIDALTSKIEQTKHEAEIDDMLLSEAKVKRTLACSAFEGEELNKRIAVQLIKKISVFDEDRVEIEYVYDDLVARMVVRVQEIKDCG